MTCEACKPCGCCPTVCYRICDDHLADHLVHRVLKRVPTFWCAWHPAHPEPCPRCQAMEEE
jgi:hypothetical protein